jgi:putative transposase
VHCVFCTKNPDPLLTPELRAWLWPFIGGIAKQHTIEPRCIGGRSDHAQLLLALPTSLSVAEAMSLIKGGSSRWRGNALPSLRTFAGQEGDAAFGLSFSHFEEVVRYLQGQEEHHEPERFARNTSRSSKNTESSTKRTMAWDDLMTDRSP